jgi:hypothetical protein
MQSLEDRFWDKILTIPEYGCYEWAGTRTIDGYGKFFYGGKKVAAHRLAWILVHGSIPDGMCLCHKCDNPSCVRVEHLFLGTRADNNADMVRKGRHVTVSGTKQPAAKIDENKARRIRELYASGKYSQCVLAAQFGIAQANISKVVLGKSWRHVL